MLWCLRAALALSILAYLPQLLDQFEHPKAAVVGVLGVGLLAAALAAGLPSGGRGAKGAPRVAPHPPLHLLDFSVLAWLVVEAASTAASVAPSVSLFGETQQHEGLLTSIGLAGLYAGARMTTRRVAVARGTLAVVLLAAVASCLVALWQLTTFGAAEWEAGSTYGTWHRPFGSLGHPNQLGVITSSAFAASIGLAATRPRERWGWMAAAALFAAITLITLSRAAWVAAGVSAGLVLLLARPDRSRSAHSRPVAKSPRATRASPVPASARPTPWGRNAAVAAVAVVMIILFSRIEPLRARAAELFALGTGSGRSRLEIWRTALAMWRAHPWLGVGPDAFRVMFDHYQTQEYWSWEWGTSAFNAHSIHLHVLATRGIAGVIAAGAMVVAAGIAMRDAWRAGTAAREMVVALAGLLSALAICGGSGAVGIAGAAATAATLGLLPGLASPGAGESARSGRVPQPGRMALAAGVLAALAISLPTAAGLRASRAAALSQEPGSPGAATLAADAERIAPWSDVMASNTAEVLRRGARARSDQRRALSQAEAAARRAVMLGPQRVSNQHELALVLLDQAAAGDRAAAARAAVAIEGCERLGPNNVLPLLQFADAATRLRQADLALPVARRAAALYPDEAIPAAILGRVELALGDTVAARASLRRSLTLTWREGRVRREDVGSQLRLLGTAPR